MSKNKSVKYFRESDYGKEPILGSKEVIGYDLFAAKAKRILPFST